MKRCPVLITVLALLLLSIVLFPGCYRDNTELSRYPKVAVPGYAAKDYYLFLYNKNDDLKYNAICNLIEDAGSIASTLSDKKADKRSPKFVLAALTYKRIVELLQSSDENIVSAALRFLQLFGPQYDKKEDLVVPVLKIRSRGRNSRYEQVVTLSAIASKNSPVSDLFLEKSINDPSWLISRAAYGLVNSLENDRIRTMLITRYRLTDAEYEKLLILMSMRNGLSRGVFAFLSKEALETKSEKIREQILGIIKNALDTAEVLQWVDKNYERLSSKGIERINNYSSLDNDFTSALYRICIRKGWVPGNDFFEQLYEKSELTEDVSKDEKLSKADILRRRDNIKNLEKEVVGNKAAADKWVAYKRKKEIFAKSVYSEIKVEYDATVKQFSERLASILDKHNVDPDKKKEFADFLSSTFMDEKTFDKATELFKAVPPEKDQ